MVKVNIRDLKHVDLDRLVYDVAEKKEGYYHSEISYCDTLPSEPEQPEQPEQPEPEKKEEVRPEDVGPKGKVAVVLEDDEGDEEKKEEEVSEEEEIQKQVDPEQMETSQFLVKIKSAKGRHSSIIKHGDRYYLDIYLSQDDPLALFVCDVDEHNMQAIHDNSVKWFSTPKRPRQKIPLDMVENMYRSPMTLRLKSQGGRRLVYNRLRLMLATHGDNVQCEVYDQKAQLVSLEDVKSDRDITLAISLDSIWIHRKTAGCAWNVRQVKVKKEVVRLAKSKKLVGFALPSDDEADEAEEADE
jgi:hypothetical protein